MFDQLKQYLKRDIPNLNDGEVKQICDAVLVRKLSKKQFLLREGDVARYKILVLKGMLRNYATSPNGGEHVLKFTAENSWTTEPESYYNGTPSQYNIDAVENTEVILWTREAFDRLRLTIPALNTFAENIINRRMHETQKRILVNISYSAEERYADFIDCYPELCYRIPLHMIASYLGVSRETLTRIRHAQLERMRKKTA